MENKMAQIEHLRMSKLASMRYKGYLQEDCYISCRRL